MKVMDFTEVQRLVESATGYGDVFSVTEPRGLKTEYRRMIRLVHPDRVQAHQQAMAAQLTDKLTRLYQAALAKDQTVTGSNHNITMTSRTGTHVLARELSAYCDMTKAFRGRSTVDGITHDTFIKVSMQPRDNQLLAEEARHLERLHSKAGDEFVMFYPELVDSFLITEGRTRLRVNALMWQEGFYNIIELRQLRPDGLDPLDAAWVWRRLLWALGGAHEARVLHGAVLPQHVIVHPRMHGVLLTDWCYSVSSDDGIYQAISALVGSRRSWYSPEVLARHEPTPQNDLIMAARTMCYLIGGDGASMNMPRTVPAAMQRYLLGITNGGVATGNAFELLARFDVLLQQLGAPYYPRAYRELKL